MQVAKKLGMEKVKEEVIDGKVTVFLSFRQERLRHVGAH